MVIYLEYILIIKYLTCKTFNTDRVLKWQLILDNYGLDIEYIKGEKNIVSDALSRIPLNGNEENTQKSIYQKEIMSEINDTEELPEGTFPINLKLIQKYQRTEPRIKAKYKDGTYHDGSFRGGSNIDIKFIICKDRIVITSKLQSYAFCWYHTYLLHPGMDRM